MQAHTRSLKRLPLQRDLAADERQRLDAAASACGRVFAASGYARVDTPLMEETELFLRKSGGELASRLYNFTDPGGYAVSLRPEFTAPVIRYVLEEVGLDDLPLRLQYSGPVFRYPGPDPGPDSVAADEPGTFTQAGAELIGGPAPGGDAEIIAMALQGLVEIGIEHPAVTIGHVGLLWELLKPYELSERARLFLVNSVGALAEGRRDGAREEAASLGLVPEAAVSADSDTRAAGESGSEFAASVLGFGLGTSAAGSTGVRSTEEIVARLAAKLSAADDPDSFDRALDFLSELSVVKGAPADALKQGREVASKAGGDQGPFDEFGEIIETAIERGVSPDAVSIDLGLVRGIAYYTGTVFDLAANGRSVGGGGRYDGLVRALGGDRDVPALGFAYNLEAVAGLSVESGQSR